MQNNVKYVFTHFVKYVTLDRLSTPTAACFKYTSNPVINVVPAKRLYLLKNIKTLLPVDIK